MKKIVYTINDNGMDGRAPTQILFASYEEQVRDDAFATHKNKQYLSKSEKILHIESHHQQLMNRLDGIDRLVLDLPQRSTT